MAELKRTFRSQHRRQQMEDLLQTRIQAPNESVNVLRLTVLADPQATKEKTFRFFMRGVKSDTFGGLRNPPTAVDGLVEEARNIERELAARARHFHRLNDVSILASVRSVLVTSVDELREIIRDVVREEIAKLLLVGNPPASLSITEVVREEFQRAIEPRGPVNLAPPSKRP